DLALFPGVTGKDIESSEAIGTAHVTRLVELARLQSREGGEAVGPPERPEGARRDRDAPVLVLAQDLLGDRLQAVGAIGRDRVLDVTLVALREGQDRRLAADRAERDLIAWPEPARFGAARPEGLGGHGPLVGILCH